MKTAMTLAALLCLALIPFSSSVWLDLLLALMGALLVLSILSQHRSPLLPYLLLLTAAPLIPLTKLIEPAMINQATDAAYRNMDSELDIAENTITQFFMNNAAALDSVEILISQYGNINDDDYQYWLTQILPKQRNQFLNIALSEELIIRHVYPRSEANLKVIGADQSSIPEQGLQYRSAYQTNQPLVIGPVTLLQGVPGIIYVRPVTNRPKLILAGVLSLQSLKEDLDLILSDSLHLQADIKTPLNDYQLLASNQLDIENSIVRKLQFDSIGVTLLASSSEVRQLISRTSLTTRLSAAAIWLLIALSINWQQVNFRIREKQRHELKKSEGELIAAQRLGKMGSWSSNDSLMLNLSDPLQELLSIDSETLLLDELLDRLHPEEREPIAQRIRKFFSSRSKHLNLEHRVHIQGHYRWFNHRIARNSHHAITGILRDIDGIRKKDEQVAKLESFDSLTGAANRHYFRQIAIQHLALCERRHTTLALVLINIDGFRSVNQNYGQATGDELLKQITGRLHSNSRKSDTVARLSGDTFALSLVDIGNSRQSVFIIEQILRRLKDPYTIAENLYPQFTIGVAMYPEDATDYDTLLRKAESALNAAKMEARGHYRYYSAQLSQQTDRRQQILSSLPGAIANDYLYLVFQPRVSSRDGRITSMEALVRWDDPVLGFVSPGEFIPIAEHTSLIGDIGQWVMKRAFKTFAEHQNELPTGVTLSINLSPRQLEDRLLPRTVQNLLYEHGVQASQFELEITEHSIAEQSDDILSNMKALNEMGFEFALDDFGTGYSNLGMLQSLPLNVLKVDMSFIRAIGSTDKSDELVRAIVNMGHTLGLKVVAEGVESAAQVQFLATINCDELQGFYYFKPQTIEDITRQILHHSQ